MRAALTAVVVSPMRQPKPGHVGEGHGEVQGHVDQGGAEGAVAQRDGEQVEEAGGRGGQRPGDAQPDEPQRALGEDGRIAGQVRGDVEHEAARPRPDRHRHEDRVQGVAVAAGEQAHRPFRPVLRIVHDDLLFHQQILVL
ncbi:hypothetical protein LUX73_32045 [Actinomadura madurae]|nr:hypothetical protein [Actinomadura madurae]MCQ0008883.1 hypothetical protein [Actinomadura madurae]